MDKPKRKRKMRSATADIASQLRDAIGASGRTHYAIGKASGVSPGIITRFASGERDLRLATAARIATALGLGLSPAARGGRAGK